MILGIIINIIINILQVCFKYTYKEEKIKILRNITWLLRVFLKKIYIVLMF